MTGPGNDLVLRFGGSLVEQLGAQLYPSVTATVAELISNAWDADAKRVWVTVPFGSSWSEESELTVLDDGNGMTRELAQETYLIVGRKRRLTSLGNKSEGGRLVHGRKGIGKLAAFGTAGILDCSTVRQGNQTNFRLNYDNIRKLDPSEDYRVEELPDPTPLVTPEGEVLEHGTRIRLTQLRMKRAISRDQFLRSMSRRFALNTDAMKIWINGAEDLTRFSLECEFRFPTDGVPSVENIVVRDGWAQEQVDGKPVRWWIGFTEKPLTEDQAQGISILANGKMAQRPFKFERAQGTSGQLGQEYLVGEVEADWLDDGIDIEDDLIQSNRDQLQLEDARLENFLNWGRRRLEWALRRRNDLRREKRLREFKAGPEIEEMLEPFTPTEQRRLLTAAQAISNIPEIDQKSVADTMRTVVEAQSDRAVREMMEAIEAQEDAFQDRLWQLVHEFSLVDARRALSLIEARLATIRKLKESIRDGSREVPDLHRIVKSDPWLLDPRWNLLGEEVDLSDMGIDFEPELDESGNRIDFLFALAPHPPAPIDEVLVVEIKRGTNANGSTRKATDNEVNKFHGYVLQVKDYYGRSTSTVVVRGLMIAQGYTQRANLIRKSLEQHPVVPFAFRTWDMVVSDTERMHTAWLNVSQGRLNEG
ncbi:ATP-binding protein [Actinosynnema sp. CA-248983]